MKTRILLADDHETLRRGVLAILNGEPDIEVVGEATTGEEAQRRSVDLAPDILLLDLSMPGPSAAETVSFVQIHSPSTRIVVFSAYNQGPTIRRLLSLGVSGYVLKDDEASAIGMAIRSVMQGATWLSAAARVALERDRQAVELDLTERDWQLLDMLVQGLDDTQIAAQLGLAVQTVRNYFHELYGKLKVSSRAEAIAWFHRHDPEAF